jgi:hypothetical protein
LTKESFDNFPSMNRVVWEELGIIECTEQEVERHLKKLNVNKSPGPDNIPPRILRECASQLAPSLATLFNKSFSFALLPQDWKIANIAPIHKKN